MNSRAKAIVELLMKNPDIKIQDIEKDLALSRRQVNYALKQLNETLRENRLPEINRSQDGTFFLDDKIVHYFSPVIQESYKERTRATDSYSEQERTYLLLLYIIASNEHLSLAHIEHYLYISKNTALNDMKNAKKYIEKYKLTIQYTRKNGYSIVGSEMQIRMLINDLVVRVLNMQNRSNIISEMHAKITFEQVVNLIARSEHHLKISYSDEGFDYVTFAIFFNFSRILADKYQYQPFFNNKVIDTVEYQKIAQYLPEEIHLRKSDYEWIVLIFLSSNVYRNEGSYFDVKILPFISEMVKQFETKTLTTIKDKQVFELRLLSHLRPAYFRVKYGLPLYSEEIVNDLSSENKNNTLLFNLVKELITPLERAMLRSFPDEEIKLLTFYFGSEMKSDNTQIRKEKKAVVVCTNGMIVSKLMLETLRELFPELQFTGSLSTREFEEHQGIYDLVFSNVPLVTELPQYILNPLMDEKEKVNLRYRVLNQIHADKVKNKLHQLVAIAQKYGVVTDEDGFVDELKDFLLTQDTKPKNTNKEEIHLPPLMSYIKPEYIQIIHQPLTWKEAIEKASQPLIDYEVTTQTYVDDLILQNDTKDCYNFFGENMSIPHQDSETEILKDGIGLLILKQPIDFPGRDQIKIVAPIAIKDTTLHLRAINQLAELAQNKSYTQKILAAETSEDVVKVMKELP